MIPIVLFRKSLAEEGEFDICRKYFPTIEYRTGLLKWCYSTDRLHNEDNMDNLLIIPRYSLLPYVKELEIDINLLGGKLINSYQQHKWIANFEWYESLKGYTPESWDDTNFFSCQKDCRFVVKGKTNSRKNAWRELMFAKDKKDALRIAGELLQDGLICDQGIIYREYIPLLSYGYYWSVSDNIPKQIELSAIIFAQEIASIVKDYVNFWVVDIAKTLINPHWIVIELNDASCSGLSECSADELYENLKKVLL